MGPRLLRVAPWLVLLAAFCLKTWTLWRHLADRHYALWGMYFDTLHMDWMSWWTGMALTHPGESLTFSTWLNAPDGAPTVMSHSLAGMHVALAGLLRLVTTGLVAHNLVALMGCAFTMVALFLLLRHLSNSGLLAAVLAALVFTFGLGWAGTLPDLEVLFFGWTPLALMAWLRYVETGSWWRLVVAAGLVALTAFAQMYYGLSVLAMLAMAALGANAGQTMLELPPGKLLRRTLLVLGFGLALALAAHARNIVTTLAMGGEGLSFALAPLPPNHVSQPLWQGLLMALFVLAPLVAAWRLRLRGAALWIVMILPLAVLSLGEELGGVDMPLRAVRAVKPILQRISFGFRFVPPVLLGIAAALALFWRHRVAVLATPWRRHYGRWYGPGLVVFFWLGAAYAPVVPRFERLPFEANAIDAAACAAPYPDSCTMTQRWVNRCLPQAGAGRPVAPGGVLAWAAGQLLLPLRAQETMPLPGPPECIAWLASAPGEGSVLEFSPGPQNGYRAYFQTFHQRPLAAFPIRNGTERNVVPSAIAQLPSEYQRGTLSTLPERAALRLAGVAAVVRYQGEAHLPCNFGIPQRVGLPPGPQPIGEAAFDAAYGPAACRDEVLSVYWLDLGKADGSVTLAP